MKNIKIIAFLAISVFSFQSWAGSEGRGGGYGWLDKNNKVYLYDFVEAGIESSVQLPVGASTDPELPIEFVNSLPASSADVETGLRAVLAKVSSKDPVTAALFREILRAGIEFKFPNPDLNSTNDIGSTPIKDMTGLVQLANQDFNNYIVSVNRNLWNELNVESKVGLIIHEIVYNVYSQQLKDESSKQARDFVSLLFSRKMDSLSTLDFYRRFYRESTMDDAGVTQRDSRLRTLALSAYYGVNEISCKSIIDKASDFIFRFTYSIYDYGMNAIEVARKAYPKESKLGCNLYSGTKILCRDFDAYDRFWATNASMPLNIFMFSAEEFKNKQIPDLDGQIWYANFSDFELPSGAQQNRENKTVKFDKKRIANLVSLTREANDLLKESENVSAGYCLRLPKRVRYSSRIDRANFEVFLRWAVSMKVKN